MKQSLTITLVLLAATAFSQKAKVDYTAIDRRVELIKPAAPEILTAELIAGCSTELEKVRAIFKWIANNISYHLKEQARTEWRASKQEDIIPDTGALKPLNERVSEAVLQKGSAVCEGYSRLFKTLCGYAGINCEVITGYARTTRRFASNHTWNAVMIGNKWELLDVTWASGYISWQKDHFIREFDEKYFLTPPDKFIEEHYPDNIHWTLLDNPPLLPEFRQSPYKQKTFIKYRIKSYSPSKGLIEASEGDTVRFVLESSDVARDRNIYSDLFPDTSVFKTDKSILLQPSDVAGNKTIYTYCVTSPGIEWLYLLYNDDVVLRYRLQLKKEKKDLVIMQ